MKIVLFANSDWYLFNFRLSLAKKLQLLGHDVLMISPPGIYGERLTASGFRWLAIPMNRQSLNPLRELQLLIHLWRLYRRERPDLAHHFTIKSVVYGSIAAIFARTPARVNAVAGMGYVFTSGAVKARLLRPVVRGLMRMVLNGKSARLILQNNDDVSAFSDAGLVRDDEIRLIKGSGVDLTRFQYGNPHRENSGAPTQVVLAARLLRDKGIAEFVEAARILRMQNRPIRFLIAGLPDIGNPSSIPESILNEWRCEGIVELLGQVGDMAALFADSHIAVLPSYREGFPKSLIEAAACGLALITTDVPGCREVVTHEVDGLLVPPGDADALANAIARLHQDPQLTTRLGSAAKMRAKTEFDEQIVIARTIAVYEELIPEFAASTA